MNNYNGYKTKLDKQEFHFRKNSLEEIIQYLTTREEETAFKLIKRMKNALNRKSNFTGKILLNSFEKAYLLHLIRNFSSKTIIYLYWLIK